MITAFIVRTSHGVQGQVAGYMRPFIVQRVQVRIPAGQPPTRQQHCLIREGEVEPSPPFKYALSNILWVSDFHCPYGH